MVRHVPRLRRALLALVIAACIACLPVVARTTYAPSSAPPGTVISLGSLSFLSPVIGWSLGAYNNRRAILRTTNGGRTWHDVTPPGMRFILTGPVGTNFLDATHAWVAGQAGGRDDAVLATADGGQTWRRTLVDVAIGPKGAPYLVPYFAFITFLNRGDGWLTAIDVGMYERIQRLYRTIDGGASWARIATNLPISEVLGFQTHRLGYGADVVEGGARPLLYRTDDGGRHWRPHRLPLPSIYHQVRVVVLFFPSGLVRGEGGVSVPALIIPLDAGSHSSLVVYHSSDGGLHWVGSTPLNLRSSGSDIEISFAGAMNGWAVTLYGLYRTTNAGRTWQPVPSRTRLRPGTVLDFVTPRIGFALITALPQQRLLRTTDAGRTWSAVWVCRNRLNPPGC